MAGESKADLERRIYALQDQLLRSDAANADLRMRNGELAVALAAADQAAFDRLTPPTGKSRYNRIWNLVDTVSKWASGEGGAPEMRAAAHEIIDYLPEWQHRQETARAAQKAKQKGKT